MSQIRYEDASNELVNAIPEFIDVFQKHLARHEEVLPYVLFGELGSFLINTYRASIDTQSQSVNTSDLLQRIIAFIEDCAESDDDRTVNLIAVGLLESLGWRGYDVQPIVEMLGPKSRTLYEQLEAGWADFDRREQGGEI